MEQLGIQPIQLVIQIVNFGILVFVLTKLLYRPVLKALEERKRKIEEGLGQAEKAKQEAEKTEKKRSEILAKAKEEARQILDAAKKVGKEAEMEIIEKAHEEAQVIIVKGKEEVEYARADMERKVKVEAIELAQAIVSKVLEGALSPKDHQLIVEKKLKEVSKQLSS